MRAVTIVVLVLGAAAIGASAQEPSTEGRYEGFTAGAGRLFWRLDTLTGRVSICLPDEMDVPVVCTPWGDGAARRRGAERPPEAQRRLLTDAEVFGETLRIDGPSRPTE